GSSRRLSRAIPATASTDRPPWRVGPPASAIPRRPYRVHHWPPSDPPSPRDHLSWQDPSPLRPCSLPHHRALLTPRDSRSHRPPAAGDRAHPSPALIVPSPPARAA